MVNVELDGEQHELRREKDSFRDAELAKLGICTMRIPTLEFLEGGDHVRWMKRLCDLLSERLGRAIRPK